LENMSKLQYVIGGIGINGIDKKSSKFISDFFADTERDTNNRSRYVPISQKDINRRNSERVSHDIEINKAFGLPISVTNDRNELEILQSSLYNEFSNHVHGRYPEMMDIYGEKTLELKLSGNLESQDIDGNYELAYFEILSEGILKGFRTALLCLGAAKMICLSDEEMKFSVGNILET
jgi:hypothetical protein